MTRQVLLIVHQHSSDPGRVARQLRVLGYGLDVRRPALGEALPATLDDHAGAIVFGGPMSANDDHLDFIRAEIDWIPLVLAAGKPFLGICLGAQMLARVLGQRVYEHPEGQAEIGFYPIEATAAGRRAGLFGGPLRAYQWHREGFDLPAGAELLATGEIFPNQAFRLGNAYGIQFHPEVTHKIMSRWVTKGAERLKTPGAQSAEHQLALRRRCEPGVIRWLSHFLQVWLSHPATSAERPARLVVDSYRAGASAES
ncbi:MAG TPA: glutamine amidotransferase [Alphaproteobacteria bacterium]|jgi:GMP synthase (glutamine-hydrolysing)|nr:glutamine amidotransferase [Alphaproteobacteria bacterium]MDP7429772.1 glutamine amidotransferase [Alphaproteobacteria bacterium]HJM50934.1 glutamine amidotransferase [Alphaproteobacteria bacterium]